MPPPDRLLSRSGPIGRAGASPIGATFSMRCASARSPASSASMPFRAAAEGETIPRKFYGTVSYRAASSP